MFRTRAEPGFLIIKSKMREPTEKEYSSLTSLGRALPLT